MSFLFSYATIFLDKAYLKDELLSVDSCVDTLERKRLYVAENDVEVAGFYERKKWIR